MFKLFVFTKNFTKEFTKKRLQSADASKKSKGRKRSDEHFLDGVSYLCPELGHTFVELLKCVLMQFGFIFIQKGEESCGSIESGHWSGSVSSCVEENGNCSLHLAE